MIDGRGEAKITDFGLAVAGDDENIEAAGTPAYMAPELLMGESSTIQSDIYALGVVLYELFTGRRVRSGRAAIEILREHAEPLSTPSSFQSDIDPQVEQVIMRCLSPEPEDRPRSVREVLAGLPGGDRLAAAIAAGETPSPDAVVAAEVDGRISATQGVMLVATLVALLALLLYFKNLTSAPALVNWTRPPVVLQDRALELIEQLGLEPAPHHSLAMESDYSIISWITQNDRSRERWSRLEHLPLYTIRWRASREPLAQYPYPFLGAPPAVFANQIEFDLQGRVRELIFLDDPEKFEEASLVEMTGLVELTPVAPELRPPRDVDDQKAWIGRRAGSSVQERLEIGFRSGAPVWLEIRGPWEERGAELGELPFATRGLQIFMLVTGLLVLLSAGFFAWRNTRIGRGDRVGAFRLALFTAAVTGTALLIGADWPPWLSDRVWILRQTLKDALYSGVLIYVLYLALEPLVRRTWPGLLISWRRLLDGRWHDSLAGRDILIGLVGGVAHSALAAGTWLLPVLRGEPASSAGGGVLSFLLSTSAAVEALGLSIGRAFFFCLMVVFLLSVFAISTRRRWVAVALMIVLMNVGFYFAMGELHWISVLIALLTVGITARYGLLAAVAMQFAFTTTFHYPLLFDSSRWFFWTSILPLVVLGGLTFFAFRRAVGGGSSPQSSAA